MTKPRFRKSNSGAAITVRLLHGDKNALLDILEDGTISLQLIYGTEESQVNREMIVFLSKLLKIPPSSLEIIAGLSGQNKLVAISGLNPESVQAVILNSLGLTQAELDRRRHGSTTDC
jgi:uncharacterized protein YggU (UPF0235/DUF167 family)